MASLFQSLLERTAKLPTAASATEGELKKLRWRVERIRAVLKDAEEREIREERVRLWLAELRDVAHESEDVLDEVEYELLRYQLECEEEEGNNSTRLSHEERGGINGSLEQQIVSEIKRINGRFEEIFEEGQKLELHEEVGQRDGVSSHSEAPLRMPTSSFIGEQGVRGREEDKCKVIDMVLLDDEDDDGKQCKENVRSVSIVGMGGLGKTTLAQLVYNDDKVVKYFEKRMWVCVSDRFDVVQLTKEILQEARGSPFVLEFSNFDSLVQSLRKVLQGKRFLLVLDDVWNESLSHWEALWAPLSTGAEGSRVLITTRNEVVSRISCVDFRRMLRLGCLSEDDCWLLFEQRAFCGRSSGDYPELVPIGRKIVRKCKGVPLTVKTLAGLLSFDFREDRWTGILTSDLWDLQAEGKDDIRPALKLSYHHLPSPLKPCFAYCAVFPRNHQFKRDQLIKMWMAHGYLKPSANKCMEDVGRGYFEDLLQRSLFQTATHYGSHHIFVMHDLMHDLALSIRSGECCEVVDGKLSSGGRARHLLLFKCTLAEMSHGLGDNLKWLRTINLISVSGVKRLGHALLDDMFQRMKYLRVLNLPDLQIEELPDSVGNLKHLRYISIRGDDLTRLPETLGNLLNLQTLEIQGVHIDIKELPKKLRDLVNLRHLHMSSLYLSMMPHGIGRLTQLRTLLFFVVGEGTGAAGIEELTGLKHLQGDLEIVVKSLNNWVKGPCNNILTNKQGLRSLTLDFIDTSCSMSIMQQQQQEELFESLQPHTNIKRLEIKNYCGGRFPEWMGDTSSSGIESLNLSGFISCGHLPVLGQLSAVKRLHVSGTHAPTSVVCQFLSGVSFPSLEELSLIGLWECEGLMVGMDQGGTLPRLCHLKIEYCHNLECVKLRHLTGLRELQIGHCKNLRELDYYYYAEGDVGISESLLGTQRQDYQVIVGNKTYIPHGVHIPSVHTMVLDSCLKLNLPLAQMQQQLMLPPSLRRFYVSDSPLAREWATNHADKLVGITCILADTDYGKQSQFFSFWNVKDMKEMIRMVEGKLHYWKYSTRKIELRWDDVKLQPQGYNSSPKEAEQVLQELVPSELVPCNGHSSIPELLIQGYQGLSFPDWLGGAAFLCHLVKMVLSGCIHCNHLPLLGQLPSLEKLHISRMPGVRCVGREFCGDGGTFQSLLTLEFHNMPQWEEWQEVKDSSFPKLQVLRIFNCPRLRSMNLLPVPLLLKLESDRWGLVALNQEPDTTINLRNQIP